MMHGIAHICRYNKIAQVGSEERDICENVIHNKNQQPQKLVCQQNMPQPFCDTDFEGLASNAEVYIFNQDDSQE